MEAVQIWVFFSLVAAVVLAAAACVGEAARAREECRQCAARVAALENELRRLHVPQAVREETPAAEKMAAPHARGVRNGAARKMQGSRIHYEIGREGVRKAGA